jgi:Protein of unknown function (DUF2786)
MIDTMDVERKAEIAKKIKALMAKTVQAGCTESEALAAADMAQRLIREYQINLSEAELIEEGFSNLELPWVSERQQFIEDRLATVIAAFTGCKAFRFIGKPSRGQGKQAKKDNYKLIFIGLKSDVAFASWLINSLFSFAASAADTHAINECHGYSAQQKREAWRAFVDGLCDRIRSRLRQLKQAAQQTSNGRSLMVIDKQALIAQYIQDRGFHITGGKKVTVSLNNNENFYAGYRRGASAGLNRPIEANDNRTLAIK